jgi:hypothetical protein
MLARANATAFVLDSARTRTRENSESHQTPPALPRRLHRVEIQLDARFRGIGKRGTPRMDFMSLRNIEFSCLSLSQ